MARQLPDALKLREIKYGAKTSREARLQAARELVGSGRVAEGLDLLLLAGDEEGAREIQARAVREGRPLWLILLRRAGLPVAQQDWLEAARAAEAAGRLREAYRAFLEGGDQESLARLQDDLPGYEIYTPQGK